MTNRREFIIGNLYVCLPDLDDMHPADKEVFDQYDKDFCLCIAGHEVTGDLYGYCLMSDATIRFLHICEVEAVK